MSGATHGPSNNVQPSLHGTGVFLPHPKTHSTRLERQKISSYNKIRKLGEASSTGSNGADSSMKQPNSQPVDSALASPGLRPLAVADAHNSTEQALPNLTPVASPTCALEASRGPEEHQGTSTGIDSAQGHSSNANMRVSIAQLSGSSWPDPLGAPEVGGWPITRTRSSGSGSRHPLPPPPPPLQQPPPPPQQDAAAGVTASRVPSQSSRSSSRNSIPATHGVEVPSSAAYFGSSAAQAPAVLPVPRPHTRSQVVSPASTPHQLLFSDQKRLLQHQQQQQRPDLLAGSSGGACSPLQLQDTQQGSLRVMMSRNNSSALLPQAADQAHLHSGDERAMMAAIDEQVLQLLQLRQQAITQCAQAAKAAAITISTAGSACDMASPQLPGCTSAASLMPISAAAQNRQGSNSSASLYQLPQLNAQASTAECATASDQNLELLTQQMSGLGLQHHLSASSLVEACAPLDSLQMDLVGSFGAGSASLMHSASAGMAAAMPIAGVNQQPQQQFITRGLNGSGSLAGGSVDQGSTPLQYQQQQHLKNNSGSLFGDQTPCGSLGGLTPAQSGGLWNATDASSLQALGQVQSGNQPGDLNAASSDMAARNAAVAAKMRQLAMVQSMQQQLQEELLQLLQ